jgi:hypothetical protein
MHPSMLRLTVDNVLVNGDLQQVVLKGVGLGGTRARVS